MGSHEGRDDVEGKLSPETGDDAEHLELVLEIEAVSALDLDRRRSALEDLRETPAADLEEQVFAHRAHLADRPLDAAAAPLDLEVPLAPDARLVLVRAVARKHGVRVRIDPAGHDDPPARVHRPLDGHRADCAKNVVAGAYRLNRPPGDGDRSIIHYAGVG